MRIIHTSDWHIGKHLCDYSLLDDQQYFFDNFYNELTILNPDVLIVAGDVYDRSIPSTEAVSLFNSVLNKLVLELSIPTVIVTGNHDSKERLCFATDLLKNNDLFIEGNINKPPNKITLGNTQKINFYSLPYFELHDVKSLYNDDNIKSLDDVVNVYFNDIIKNLDTSEINVLIGHGFYLYSDLPLQTIDEAIGGTESLNIKMFDSFDYVALGHIHSAKSIGSHKMRYAGSPLKYSIDESNHKKSYTIIDINSKDNISIRTKEIIPLRDVRQICGSFEHIMTVESQGSTDDYVFIKLTDSDYILGAINKLKLIFPHILGLSYDNIICDSKLNFPKKLSANDDGLSLFSDFFKQVTDTDMNDNQIELVKDIFNQIKRN